MNQQKRERIFATLKKLNPQPTTELIYRNEFELLIAVVLSAQATDIAVNKASQPLFKVAPTPEAMLALKLSGLKRYIKTIGLYNSKAKHILQTCKILIEQHDSHVPANRVALEALPGVGRKTANVILNTAFGQPTIAVDTHIFRVANRTRLALGKNPLEVEKKLMKYVPKAYLYDAHHWLILHGRYVCTARRPRCGSCPVARWCEYPEKCVD